jgi:MFS family permease
MMAGSAAATALLRDKRHAERVRERLPKQIRLRERRDDARVALAGAYGFVVLGLTDSVIGVAWPSIARTFGLPLSMLSVLLVAAGVGYLLTAIPSGHLLTHFGAARAMAVASLAAGWRARLTPRHRHMACFRLPACCSERPPAVWMRA